MDLQLDIESTPQKKKNGNRKTKNKSEQKSKEIYLKLLIGV